MSKYHYKTLAEVFEEQDRLWAQVEPPDTAPDRLTYGSMVAAILVALVLLIVTEALL